MTQLLYSKELQKTLTTDLIREMSQLHFAPKLLIILVGDDPPSAIYTANKKLFCEKIGAQCEIKRFDSTINKEQFITCVKDLSNLPTVHGCLVQLPLPKHLSEVNIGEIIPSYKDVDGFHPTNVQALYRGDTGDNCLIPCTPKGIISLLTHNKIDLQGRTIAIIGRSTIVGRPLSILCTNYDATVTLCHSKSKDLKSITRESEIIVTAIGVPKYFDDSFLNSSGEQILIDVGINKIDNKICGDVDFHKINNKVAAITPVPGGVGPMTITSLAQNLLQATKMCL